MSTSNHCSKCSTNIGTCNCAGCKDYFCTKHFIAHRKDLQTNLEQITDNHHRLLKQFNENNYSTNLKNTLFSQITQWQNGIMQKVQQTADNIRQQITEMLNHHHEDTKKRFQTLVEELQKHKEEDDYVEDDLVRLNTNVHQLQQELEELQQRSAVELHIEKNDCIDWNHLIYIESKPNSAKERKNMDLKSGTSVYRFDHLYFLEFEEFLL